MKQKAICNIAAGAVALAMTAAVNTATAATITVEETGASVYCCGPPDLSTFAGTDLGPNVASNTFAIRSGSQSGDWRTPYEDLADAGFPDSVNNPFFTVGVSTSNDPAHMMLNGEASTLRFAWGSVDAYNSLIFKMDDAVVDTVTGSQVLALGGIENESVTLATIVADSNFNKVVFDSDGTNAFEFSNVSAVPLPAAGWMLLAGLGGLAAMRRRQKS